MYVFGEDITAPQVAKNNVRLRRRHNSAPICFMRLRRRQNSSPILFLRLTRRQNSAPLFFLRLTRRQNRDPIFFLRLTRRQNSAPIFFCPYGEDEKKDPIFFFFPFGEFNAATITAPAAPECCDPKTACCGKPHILPHMAFGECRGKWQFRPKCCASATAQRRINALVDTIPGVSLFAFALATLTHSFCFVLLCFCQRGHAWQQAAKILWSRSRGCLGWVRGARAKTADDDVDDENAL